MIRITNVLIGQFIISIEDKEFHFYANNFFAINLVSLFDEESMQQAKIGIKYFANFLRATVYDGPFYLTKFEPIIVFEGMQHSLNSSSAQAG